MKQRIGFLYLKTGGGHISGANALIACLKEKYPNNAEYIPQNGFKGSNRISRIFFEKGYLATSNYFEPGYVAFYQLTKSKKILTFCRWLLRPFIVKNLVTFLKAEKITKLICLHEILIPLARIAIDRVNPSIPLISIVMDPFTAHPSWFYAKNTELIVFPRNCKKKRSHTMALNRNRFINFLLCFRGILTGGIRPRKKLQRNTGMAYRLIKKSYWLSAGGKA